MKFLVITHVKHILEDNKWFAYAPYVREMNLWFKHVDEVVLVAPKSTSKRTDIDLGYEHDSLILKSIPEINFTSPINLLLSVFKLPLIFFKVFQACRNADHIHLRCPGNIGLIGCMVQIFFPKKTKTAKYAGNWNPKSDQPLSYKLQKWLLSSTLLTKNMQVMVYGNWPNQTKNIKSFFTASFQESENQGLIHKDFFQPYTIIFVGSLVRGKQPLFCIKLVESLNKRGIDATLDVYGDGVLKSKLKDYIALNHLSDKIIIHGNVAKQTLKVAYKAAHFVVLPSKSEGWPKALAEGMFFGAIPIATDVSCVGWMLDEGRRGIIIPDDLEEASKQIVDVIKNGNLKSMSIASQQWSHQYTMEGFEGEIKKLLKN